MAVFRVERNTGYTVMSNHHLRNKELSLKAKGLLSQMLSLPEDWDYTLAGLSYINREKSTLSAKLSGSLKEPDIFSVQGSATRKDACGELITSSIEQPPKLWIYLHWKIQHWEILHLENPTQEKPTLENPMQLNKDIQKTDLPKKEKIKYGFIKYPFHSYPFP